MKRTSTNRARSPRRSLLLRNGESLPGLGWEDLFTDITFDIFCDILYTCSMKQLITAQLDHGASFYSGKQSRAKADHYARLRKRLQHKGTRSVIRRLTVISGRE